MTMSILEWPFENTVKISHIRKQATLTKKYSKFRNTQIKLFFYICSTDSLHVREKYYITHWWIFAAEVKNKTFSTSETRKKKSSNSRFLNHSEMNIGRQYNTPGIYSMDFRFKILRFNVEFADFQAASTLINT